MATATSPIFTNDKAEELTASLNASLSGIAGKLGRIAAAQEAAGGVPSTPTWDASAGCYDNASVRAWLSTVRDGREYGVSIPLTASTTLTKLGANAGMAVPTLSVGSVAGVDPYRGVGPFVYAEANGYVDSDGTPHVTAIRGGEAFSRTDADVFVLAPVLYVKYVTNADTMEIWVSDTWHPGYELQPHATLPDGTARPYMLYAKYPLGYVESGGSGAGHAASRSGLQPWTMSATNASGAASTAVSHDGLISIMATATTGYSGRSVADDWYLKVMFWLKYATKNSQAYFPQCSGYNLSYPVTVAESNASRVIISKENAANLVVGSSVLVGTDQNTPQDHRIKSIGTYDAKNSAVYLDGATVSPTTGMKVFTKPWFSGCCDAVEGDGVLGSGGTVWYPCVLQGIEFGHGMTEVVGDVIVSSDGGTGWHPYVCHDSRKEARSVTSDYVRCAKTLPSDSAEGWHYALAPDATDEGLIFGSTSGGGTSTGLCDGSFTKKESAAGTREWRALGALGHGESAGLCCVSANDGLDFTWWNLGSRLSATGRSRG